MLRRGFYGPAAEKSQSLMRVFFPSSLKDTKKRNKVPFVRADRLFIRMLLAFRRIIKQQTPHHATFFVPSSYTLSRHNQVQRRHLKADITASSSGAVDFQLCSQPLCFGISGYTTGLRPFVDSTLKKKKSRL